jgi:gluconolactonase
MKLFVAVLFLSVCEIVTAQVVKLSSVSYQFLEGPVWDGKRALYFSDQNAGKVYKYVAGEGFSTVRSGELTNGMVYDRSGFLYVCEMGTSNRIIQMDTLGIFQKVVANTYNNKPFNRPNDLCRDKKGGIYFSDPTWGTMNQDKQAVYYIKPSGEVIRISGDFQKPNGLCLSLDGNLLYVDDWSDKYVYVFDVQADGTAINKRIFCTLQTSPGQTGSGADGMKIDSQGTLYVATSTGIQVIDKNGIYLKTITLPETPSNVAFGGKDLKTLFITAGKSLYSTTVEISGNPLTSKKVLPNKAPAIYPNPTSGIVQTSLQKIKRVKVFSLSGSLMFDKTSAFSDGSINLNSLPNGCYLLNIEGDEQVLAEKIIIRK